VKKKIIIIGAMFLQFATEAADPASDPAAAVVPDAAAAGASPAVSPAAQEEPIGALRDRLEAATMDEKIQIFKERVSKISEISGEWTALSGTADGILERVVNSPTKENFKALIDLYDKFRGSIAKDMLIGPALFANIDCSYQMGFFRQFGDSSARIKELAYWGFRTFSSEMRRKRANWRLDCEYNISSINEINKLSSKKIRVIADLISNDMQSLPKVINDNCALINNHLESIFRLSEDIKKLYRNGGGHPKKITVDKNEPDKEEQYGEVMEKFSEIIKLSGQVVELYENIFAEFKKISDIALQLKVEYAPLSKFIGNRFATMCRLYRNIVVFANELGQDPEEFVKMVLRGEDPTEIKDGVIWSTRELTDARKKEIADKNIEYDRNYKDVFESFGIATGRNSRYKYDAFTTYSDEYLTVQLSVTERKGEEIPRRPFRLPLREDTMGGFNDDPEEPFFVTDHSLAHGTVGGWKLHVSATPSSAAKVAESVVPYLQKNKIYYKIIPDTGLIRRFCLEMKLNLCNYSQYIKFITIYPRNRKEGAKVACELDRMLCGPNFTRKDFVNCSGEFPIGKSGAISTRYVGDYNGNSNSDNQRVVPVVPHSIFSNLKNSPPMYPLYYCGLNVSGDLVLSEDLSEEQREMKMRKTFVLFRENMMALGLAVSRDYMNHINMELLQEVNIPVVPAM
jgi:hypothetical protein